MTTREARIMFSFEKQKIFLSNTLVYTSHRIHNHQTQEIIFDKLNISCRILSHTHCEVMEIYANFKSFSVSKLTCC